MQWSDGSSYPGKICVVLYLLSGLGPSIANMRAKCNYFVNVNISSEIPFYYCDIGTSQCGSRGTHEQ